jgi:ornithine cyclodeaminase/alanine dehydrogenase-like protein (mu-crystallin family)
MLFLDRNDVAALLPMEACIGAVERAFVAHARGELPAAPGVLGSHVGAAGFHVKTAAIGGTRGYYAAKVNANYPQNPERSGLPAIQGLIALFDLADGRPLALLDSIEITILRTAAASAIAARHLARAGARTLFVCGCGTQGRAHLRALAIVRPLERVLAYDRDAARSRAFANEMGAELALEVEAVADVADAMPRCDMAATCTPARKELVGPQDVRPGQFIAAVGADSEGKQELDPRVLAGARVVADIAAQAAHMGELQHAIAAGLMGIADLHAELGEIVAGSKPGRSADDEIFVFDSTGTALQDVAAAAVAYERALASHRGRELSLAGSSP